ncbi:MAG TPA: cytochrome bc complex cytochrome b subunit [Jatrophihabitans sp.]|jgi:ubiquinol-cytochrome c reductase cytochrome b subunit|nr:cytochrome bc complex cytochrome b subunit [Jatrophihabitans sp.]
MAAPIGRAARFIDERARLARYTRAALNKVFPDHWSFLLGEIALYSFIVLLITGTYLTFFFDPSMAPTVYHGRYVPMQGVTVSRAYASTLDISFDVRGGLLVRQIHYWAALLFIAATFLHMLRVFFTGAFRKPRELNWLIGLLVLVLSAAESYFGHLLPDDLLSGTGLRVADASILSIPVVGTWLSFLIFGGPFPGTKIIGRLYIAHVLLLPALLVVLIAAHIGLVVRQRHTGFPGPGRTEQAITGQRLMPYYAVKTGGLFFVVFGVLAALGGLAQINPVWLYGPYDPAQVSAGSGPDWFLAFIDGASRLFPSWEIRLWGHDVPPVFWATVVLPGILIVLAAAYPYIEARLTKDRATHNLLQRPRDVPVRTSLGAMALTFVIVLFVSGGNDTIARVFGVSLNALIWGGRIALLILPPLAYLATYRVCLGLQRHDREVLQHGIETGIVKVLPTGEFIEVHQPLGHGPLRYAGRPVPKRVNQLVAPMRQLRGFFYPVKEKPEIQAALDESDAGSTAPALTWRGRGDARGD